MQSITSQLADMIQVIDHLLQVTLHAFRRGLLSYPVGHHHPGIQCPTDHSPSFYQNFQLLITELTVVIDQGPAVIMTGPYGPVKNIHSIPKRIITQMRGIEYDAEAL